MTRFGIDELRAAVKLFDACRETFNQKYTAEQLVLIYRAHQTHSHDIYPDEWSARQVEEALNGYPPKWDDNYQPVYR